MWSNKKIKMANSKNASNEYHNFFMNRMHQSTVIAYMQLKYL